MQDVTPSSFHPLSAWQTAARWLCGALYSQKIKRHGVPKKVYQIRESFSFSKIFFS